MQRKKLIWICAGLTVAGFTLRYNASSAAVYIIGNAIQGYSLIALVSLIANGLVRK